MDDVAVQNHVVRRINSLRRNDPNETDLFLIMEELALPGGAGELANALETNEHVKHFHFSGLPSTATDIAGLDQLLDVLESRKMLESVEFYEGHWGLIANRILRSFRRNSALQTVEFCFSEIDVVEVVAFLDAAGSLTKFILYDSGFVENTEVQGGQGDDASVELAKALQRHTNIETLDLEGLDDSLLIPILQRLGNSVKVLKCSIWATRNVVDGDMACSRAIQDLLSSTTSLRKFDFCLDVGQDNHRVAAFKSIAQGLIDSKSVTDITFRDQNLNREMESIFQNKKNFYSLSMYDHTLPNRHLITSWLRKPTSRSLELDNEEEVDNSDTNACSYLQDIVTSNLECFKIGVVSTEEQLQLLIDTIPSMRLTTLEIRWLFSLQHRKADIIHAVQRNSTLLSVVGKVVTSTDLTDPGDLEGFNEAERKVLNSFALRNQRRIQWIANPSMVPKSLWANAISSSAHEDSTGPGTLYSILQATLCGLVDTDYDASSVTIDQAYLEQLVAQVAALNESQAQALAQVVALGDAQVQLLAQVAANGKVLAELQAMVLTIVQLDSD